MVLNTVGSPRSRHILTRIGDLKRSSPPDQSFLRRSLMRLLTKRGVRSQCSLKLDMVARIDCKAARAQPTLIVAGPAGPLTERRVANIASPTSFDRDDWFEWATNGLKGSPKPRGSVRTLQGR